MSQDGVGNKKINVAPLYLPFQNKDLILQKNHKKHYYMFGRGIILISQSVQNYRGALVLFRRPVYLPV